MAESWDSGTKEAVKQIPLLTVSLLCPRQARSCQPSNLDALTRSTRPFIAVQGWTEGQAGVAGETFETSTHQPYALCHVLHGLPAFMIVRHMHPS